MNVCVCMCGSFTVEGVVYLVETFYTEDTSSDFLFVCLYLGFAVIMCINKYIRHSPKPPADAHTHAHTHAHTIRLPDAFSFKSYKINACNTFY